MQFGACSHDHKDAVTLLFETVEEAIESVTPGLWTKAIPPPKSLAVLFCSRTSIKSGKPGVHKLADIQPVTMCQWPITSAP
jgi:hypothetical protein